MENEDMPKAFIAVFFIILFVLLMINALNGNELIDLEKIIDNIEKIGKII